MMSADARTVIVTGATSGLGRRCARTLAASGRWTVLLTGRDPARLATTASEIAAETGRDCPTLLLDLADTGSIRAAVDACGRRVAGGELPPLHALVDNAGLQVHGPMQRTRDGFEMTFGVNHLGVFLFTERLRPLMAQPSRLVIVTSGTHDPRDDGRIARPLPMEAMSLALPPDRSARRVRGIRRYSTSKLANILYAYELTRRAPELSVVAFDPGPTPETGLLRTAPRVLQRLASSPHLRRGLSTIGLRFSTVERSGDAMANLVLDESLWSVSGRYYQSKGGKVTERRSSEMSYDVGIASRLWRDSEQILRGVGAL